MTTLAQDIAEQRDSASSELPELTGLDRCDSCGAQAYVRVIVSGNELLFCGHHANRHGEKLRAIAEVWQDETHKIQS